jgi:hypothetical protein
MTWPCVRRDEESDAPAGAASGHTTGRRTAPHDKSGVAGRRRDAVGVADVGRAARRMGVGRCVTGVATESWAETLAGPPRPTRFGTAEAAADGDARGGGVAATMEMEETLDRASVLPREVVRSRGPDTALRGVPVSVVALLEGVRGEANAPATGGGVLGCFRCAMLSGAQLTSCFHACTATMRCRFSASCKSRHNFTGCLFNQQLGPAPLSQPASHEWAPQQVTGDQQQRKTEKRPRP